MSAPLNSPTLLPPPASAPASAPAPAPAPALAPPVFAPPRLTTFSTLGYLNAKHVSSGFVKQDSQSFQARRKTDADWDRDDLAKRRRLLGDGAPDEAPTAPEGEEEEGKVGVTGESGNVLLSGEARMAKEKAQIDEADSSDGEVSLLNLGTTLTPTTSEIRGQLYTVYLITDKLTRGCFRTRTVSSLIRYTRLS